MKNKKDMHKVKQKDLVGDIKGFPIEIVQKMVSEQVRQGNPADVSVFQGDACRPRWSGGFEWYQSREGHDFWDAVIGDRNFDLFFDKYPKEHEADSWIDPKGRRMLVWDEEDVLGGESPKEALVIAKLPGNPWRSYVAVSGYDEHNYKKGLYYVPHAYQHAKPIPEKEEAVELTLDQIAEKFGVNVDRLKIKKL